MKREAGRDKTGKRDKITMLVMWEKRVESRIDRAGWYDCTELFRVEWLQSEGLKPSIAQGDDCSRYTPVIFKKGYEIWR